MTSGASAKIAPALAGHLSARPPEAEARSERALGRRRRRSTSHSKALEFRWPALLLGWPALLARSLAVCLADWLVCARARQISCFLAAAKGAQEARELYHRPLARQPRAKRPAKDKRFNGAPAEPAPPLILATGEPQRPPAGAACKLPQNSRLPESRLLIYCARRPFLGSLCNCTSGGGGGGESVRASGRAGATMARRATCKLIWPPGDHLQDLAAHRSRHTWAPSAHLFARTRPARKANNSIKCKLSHTIAF